MEERVIGGQHLTRQWQSTRLVEDVPRMDASNSLDCPPTAIFLPEQLCPSYATGRQHRRAWYEVKNERTPVMPLLGVQPLDVTRTNLLDVETCHLSVQGNVREGKWRKQDFIYCSATYRRTNSPATTNDTRQGPKRDLDLTQFPKSTLYSTNVASVGLENPLQVRRANLVYRLVSSWNVTSQFSAISTFNPKTEL
jgi:hypothetical protein